MEHACNRRSFLSCGAYVVASFAALPAGARYVFAEEAAPVAKAPFARVEKLADDVWVVISTPIGPGGFQPATLSNGGIVRGTDKVLAIEGFNEPRGAAWLSGVCKELTGRRPDYVVLTHFHGDHSKGLPGYQNGADGPQIVATAETRRLLLENLHKEPPQAEEGQAIARADARLLLPDTILVDTSKPTTIDLGGRSVTLRTHGGHTPSDLTVVLDDPHVVFCGDLFFNRKFPYYGDAIPTRLNATLETMKAAGYTHLVPGHGVLATPRDFDVYIELVHHVGDAAKRAVEAGTPASEAWKDYTVPEKLGKWDLFRPDITRFAFEAWERELAAK